MQYSYQFDDALQQEWNWSERYSPQPEILRYAEHVVERFGLLNGIDFDRRVASATYDETACTWTLSSESGDTLSARFCVMATGCLSAPNWPPIAGYDDFAGDIHHTALWPHETVDFTSKRVAVIGTGSSAIQSIPHIAEAARELTVFQRTPNYSVPAHNRPMDPAYRDSVKADYKALRSRAKQRMPGIDGDYNAGSAFDVSNAERTAEYERRWQQGGLLFLQSYGDVMRNQAANDTMVDFIHGKIRGIVSDAEVADLLCPANIIGGKRMCVDSNYYATYNRDNVALVDIRSQPIKSINEAGLLVGDTQYDVDIIVVATGFDAMTGALNRIDIRGKGGESLRERWKDGPSSYLGLAMAEFPNLFTVTGPGSPSVLTNMLPTLEQHVEWISDCIVYLRDNQYRVIEASHDAEGDWWDHVQEVAQQGLKHSTNSWYLGANIEGKASVFMPYLGGLPDYLTKCDAVVANGYDGFILS